MKKKNQVSNVIQLFPVETHQEKYKLMLKRYYRLRFLEQSDQYLRAEQSPFVDQRQSNG